jgi:hypothetical protein
VRNLTSNACDRLRGSGLPPPRRLPALFALTPPETSTNSLRARTQGGHLVFLAAFLALFIACLPAMCVGQGANNSDAAAQLTELLRGVPDVTIFVVPTSGDTARVSLAFSGREDHRRVRKEILRLRENGWGIADGVNLSDRSMGSSGRVTTSGHFELVKAPQVVNNTPVLLPYLQAFQDRGHVTVVYLLSELRPYNGIDKFETPALVVRRMPAENAYQYEALIQDHKGKLPAISATEPSQVFAPPAAGSVPHAAPGALPSAPFMLALCVLGLVGGLCMYMLVARRARRRLRRRRAR